MGNQNISRKDAKVKTNCHFDPFGDAQGRLREKSFLDPSQSLGMTGLGPSLGVFASWREQFVSSPFSL